MADNADRSVRPVPRRSAAVNLDAIRVRIAEAEQLGPEWADVAVALRELEHTYLEAIHAAACAGACRSPLLRVLPGGVA